VKLFAPGDSVVWRAVDRKQRIVETVWPGRSWRTAKTRPSCSYLSGTVGKRRRASGGGPRNRFVGDPYSLGLAFDAETWDLLWRYINLEDPWLRTTVGFDSRDVPGSRRGT